MRRLVHFALWMVLAQLFLGGAWPVASVGATLWVLVVLRVRRTVTIAVVWAVAGALTGGVCVGVAEPEPARPVAAGRFVGLMAAETTWLETLAGGSYVASLDGVMSGSVECTESEGARCHVRGGERWLVMARLEAVRGPGNPHCFDHGEWLRSRGIVARAEVSARLLVGVGNGVEAMPARLAGWWREQVQAALSGTRLRAIDRGILWALMAGNQRLMPKEARGRLAVAGVAHLMAISGLHLGCISLFALCLAKLLLGWTRPGRGRWLALLGGWLAGGWFLVVCGMPTSAVRAFVMITGLAWSRLRGRDYDLWTWLGVATIGILGLRPHALHEAGFQLSTLAVVAIAIACGPLRTVPPVPATLWEWVRRRGGELGRVGAAAWSGTFVPAWWHFGVIAWWSVPVNIIFVPVVSLWVLPLALLSVPARPLAGPVARVCVKGSVVAIEVLGGLLELAAPLLQMGTRPWPGLMHAAAVGGLLLGVVLLRAWRHRSMALALALALALWIPALSQNRNWSVHFFDVGDGDMALIELPCGQRWLVDGGPPGAGRGVLTPYLRREGVGRIDRLFITHGHADHYGGLLELERHVSLCEIWINGGVRSMEVASALQRRHSGCGEAIRPVIRSGARGVEIGECETRLKMLWPPAGWPVREENENSLALEVSYAERRFVLPGDLEGRTGDESGEPVAVQMSEALSLDSPVWVVKLPHHGRASPLLSNLLMRSPAAHFVVPSGGRRARRQQAQVGWPLRDERWWWWTRESGAMEFFHDGSQWRVQFFRSSSESGAGLE